MKSIATRLGRIEKRQSERPCPDCNNGQLLQLVTHPEPLPSGPCRCGRPLRVLEIVEEIVTTYEQAHGLPPKKANTTHTLA